MDSEEKIKLSPEIVNAIREEVKAAVSKFEKGFYAINRSTKITETVRDPSLQTEITNAIQNEVKRKFTKSEDSLYKIAHEFLDGLGKLEKEFCNSKTLQFKTILSIFIYVVLACTSGFITYNECYDSKSIFALAATAVLMIPFFAWNLFKLDKSLIEIDLQCEGLIKVIREMKYGRVLFSNRESFKQRIDFIGDQSRKASFIFIAADGLFFLSIFCSTHYARRDRLDADKDLYTMLDVACYYLASFVFLIKHFDIMRNEKTCEKSRKRLQEAFEEYEKVVVMLEKSSPPNREVAGTEDQEEDDYQIVTDSTKKTN